jgi:hypothetical protein
LSLFVMVAHLLLTFVVVLVVRVVLVVLVRTMFCKLP